LRSRFYSPETGRFQTRDSWQGDYNRPLSLNRWNYVEGNPINRTDPSGFCYIDDQSDECIPYEPGPPNTSNYNEKIEPSGIHWVSNTIGNNISTKLAPIYNADGRLVTEENGAQFEIAGHERTPTTDCLKWSTGSKKDRVCEKYRSANVNFCGQVVLSAILSQLIPGITAKTVIEALNYQTGTSNTDLAEYLNKNYSGYVEAKAIKGDRFNQVDSFFNYISASFGNSTLIAPIVNIVSGNKNLTNPPPDVNGKLGITGGINHWVLITGISTRWQRGDQRSPYNWVRIFNPFDNQTEYYWWLDFSAAWNKPGGQNSALSIKMLPHK
jgi:hypothetical protein